jgi:ribonuclease VapC
LIVDTSALIAVFTREPDHEPILIALLDEDGIIPSPVVVEFFRVVSRRGWDVSAANALLDVLTSARQRVIAFSEDDAKVAAKANLQYGSGLGNGGLLNMLDLMVYAVAKTRGQCILCTGRDFASTDVDVHPASRPT